MMRRVVAALAAVAALSGCASWHGATDVRPAVQQSTNSVWPDDEPAGGRVPYVELDCWDTVSCDRPGHRVFVPAEDAPEWNCLTMGNHSCGPEWQPAADGMSEGPDGTRHVGCLVRFGETSYVVCPDGWVSES